MSKAIFKKNHLEFYQMVEEPGTYIVNVASNVKSKYLIEDGDKSRYIVNLRVSTLDKLKEAVDILDHREECQFDEVKHCFLSGTIWENSLDETEKLPTKGENVIATFNYVEDKLLCTNVALIPRKRLNMFDYRAYSDSVQLFQKLLKNKI